MLSTSRRAKKNTTTETRPATERQKETQVKGGKAAAAESIKKPDERDEQYTSKKMKAGREVRKRARALKRKDAFFSWKQPTGFLLCYEISQKDKKGSKNLKATTTRADMPTTQTHAHKHTQAWFHLQKVRIK